MNYQATVSDGVIRLDDNAFIPADPANSDYVAYLEWVAEGNTPAPIPTPTVESIVQRFLPQLQSWIDGVAQQNGYDSALSCITYANSTIAQWAADAHAMIKYRDALWAWAYSQQVTLAAMAPAQLALLTADQIIAQAPKPADSGWTVHANT